MYPRKTNESWRQNQRRQEMKEDFKAPVTVEDAGDGSPETSPISWPMFLALSRDTRRSIYMGFWKKTRPQGFWPEGVLWDEKAEDARRAWSKLKGNELQMDIERWYKQKVGRSKPGRPMGEGRKPVRENGHGVKGCLRTYAIHMRKCYKLESLILQVRQLDRESQVFEDTMELVRNLPIVKHKTQQFHQWNQELVSLTGISESTEVFEVCLDEHAELWLHSHAADSVVRRTDKHDDVCVQYRDVKLWSFDNVAPDFTMACTGEGKKKMRMYRMAIENLHYYLQMKKSGWVWVWTNFEVRKHFTGRWKMLQQQLQKGKISIRQAREEVTANAEGTVTALNFLKILQEERQTQDMMKKYLTVRKMAANHMRPWKPYDAKVKQFLAQLPPLKPLDGSTKRFFLLVLVGPSRTAKTMMARDLWGAEQTYIVNCKGSVHPNLRGYVAHRAIVWDEATAEFVLENRGLLQSGIEGCQIQSSPTQQSARWVFLYGVAQVVTTNEWPDEHSPYYDGWLKENCIVRRLTEPLYVE